MPFGPAMNGMMWASLAVILAGMAMVGLPRLLVDEGVGTSGPYWVVIAGYFVALAGSAGLFVGWVVKRRDR
jgi:hypothetical protein